MGGWQLRGAVSDEIMTKSAFPENGGMLEVGCPAGQATILFAEHTRRRAASQPAQEETPSHPCTRPVTWSKTTYASVP
jgi:hypothetical protein